MGKCPSCGKINVGTNKFCANCGKKLPDRLICPGCNNRVSSKDPFCKHCGISLKKTKIKKPPKKKTHMLKKSLIALGSFIAFLIIVTLGLYIFSEFYFSKKYALVYVGDGTTKLIDKAAGPSFGELTICQELDSKTFAPLDQISEFKIGTNELCASIHVSNIKDGDIFSYKIIQSDTREEILS